MEIQSNGDVCTKMKFDEKPSNDLFKSSLFFRKETIHVEDDLSLLDSLHMRCFSNARCPVQNLFCFSGHAANKSFCYIV